MKTAVALLAIVSAALIADVQAGSYPSYVYRHNKGMYRKICIIQVYVYNSTLWTGIIIICYVSLYVLTDVFHIIIIVHDYNNTCTCIIIMLLLFLFSPTS